MSISNGQGGGASSPATRNQRDGGMGGPGSKGPGGDGLGNIGTVLRRDTARRGKRQEARGIGREWSATTRAGAKRRATLRGEAKRHEGG